MAPGDVPVVDRDAVEQALKKVQDPCSISMGNPMDLVTMGLIESIDINGGRVEILIILTDPNCLFFTTMEKYITDMVMDVPGVTEVDVDISGNTLWSEDLIRKPGLPVVAISSGNRSE